MYHAQKQKGITLIALVVTIIILIILAGVSINLVLGENGIINKAKTAKEQHEDATIKEKIEEKIAEVEIEEITNGRTLTLQKLYENLETKDENINLEDYNEGDTVLKGTYTLAIKVYEFIIDGDFKVVVGEIVGEAEGEKPVQFGEMVWSGDSVSINLSSTISDDIEYQINKTIEAEWIKGTEVTGLKQGDILYVRVNDGTTVTGIQQIEIKDTIKPEEFSITTSDITYESVKISGSTQDLQTGLASYSYIVEENGTIVKEVKNQTVEEYTITGLSEQTEYVVYMLAYDMEGNERKSNEETITTEAMDVAKMFGQYVDYGIDIDGDGDITNDWQIFYKEDDKTSPNYGATYIIADYYVPYTKMTTSISNAGMNFYGATYIMNWLSVPTYRTITDKVKEVFMYDYTGTTEDNVKCASTLLDVNSWESDFVTEELKAKEGMAIGGPTLNMWCASWNKVYPNEKITPTIKGIGYQVNNNSDFSLYEYTGYKNAPNMYFHALNSVSGFANNYYLAGPSSYATSVLMQINRDGYFGADGYNGRNTGVRPLVYLPSTVKLEPSGTENLWDINYGE